MFEKVGQIYVPIEEAVVPQNVVYQQELPNLPTRIIRPAEVQSTVQQAPRYIPQQQVVYLPRESESIVPAIEAPAKVVVPEYASQPFTSSFVYPQLYNLGPLSLRNALNPPPADRFYPSPPQPISYQQQQT